MTKPKLFAVLASLEFISTLLIVASTRAYVQANYGWTLATEFLWLSQWFVMQKLMIENNESRTWLGYCALMLGTCTGALSGIWITKILYGH